MNEQQRLRWGLQRRRIVVCNCASYCYFSLAIILFSLGTVLTIMVLDSDTISPNWLPPNLTHMWLIGPIFISSGLMFAVKTILYIRKETMIALLARRPSLLRELQFSAYDPHLANVSISIGSLPPPYETVVRDLHSEQPFLTPATSLLNTPGVEMSPPTYEEAVLLSTPTIETDGQDLQENMKDTDDSQGDPS